MAAVDNTNDAPAIRKLTRWSAPRTKAGREQERLGWLLILPTVLVVVAVALYPLFETFRLSFTNYRASRPDRWRYIGFENYRDLLSDSTFHTALKNTLILTVTAVGLETILGMVIALTIHSNFKGRGFVRTSMLVPWAIPTVVSALLWSWMLHNSYGIVNSTLIRVGLENFRGFDWVGNTGTTLMSVVAVDVWKTTPFMTLLLLAGMQIIPEDVYEASKVDGASKWQQFWQITLPLLKPALLVALIFRTIATFMIFDLIFVMRTYSTATMSVAVYAQQQLMNNQRYGYGSAIAVVIFLCIGVLVMGYTRLIKIDEA